MPGWNDAMTTLPVHGQQVWYFGPMLGVWRGHYEFHADAMCSPHLFICGESPGVCDRMDAPYWMPYADGQDRPAPPAAESE